MDKIRTGLQHWKAFHPNIRTDVSSYFVEESGTLIDPMLPPDAGLEWFRGREPRRVVLTNRHHLRDSIAFAEEFDCPILCHEAGLHEFEAGPDVEGFRFDDQLAPGIVALELGVICPEETVLHLDLAEGCLSFADGLIRHGEQPGFVPDRYLGDDPEAIKAGLREAAGGLLDRDFDCLLFAHGEPLLGGGKEALREFAAGR